MPRCPKVVSNNDDQIRIWYLFDRVRIALHKHGTSHFGRNIYALQVHIFWQRDLRSHSGLPDHSLRCDILWAKDKVNGQVSAPPTITTDRTGMQDCTTASCNEIIISLSIRWVVCSYIVPVIGGGSESDIRFKTHGINKKFQYEIYFVGQCVPFW